MSDIKIVVFSNNVGIIMSKATEYTYEGLKFNYRIYKKKIHVKLFIGISYMLNVCVCCIVISA